MIRVAIAGAGGRMGREVVRAVHGAEDMELVLCVDPACDGQPVDELCGVNSGDLTFRSDLKACLADSKAEVLVEFSIPDHAVSNAIAAIENGAAPVIGTTGLTPSGIEELRKSCEKSGVPAMIVPNFSLGAVLMMRFAEEAARWLPDAEIIELHHNKKADAPSGTAMLTAEKIGSARTHEPSFEPTKTEKVPGARGGKHEEVPIHSVRLPGLLAHQMVIFGGSGEVLTIRHDSMDRSSFMPGVLEAVRGVSNLNGLVIGLDRLLLP